MSAPAVEDPQNSGTTDPLASPASEFEPMAPELRPGGTVVLAGSEIHIPRNKYPGIQVKIKAMRTRHLLQVGRILTGTVRPLNLFDMFDPIIQARQSGDTASQTAGIVAALTTVFLTVPHSEEEFISLLNNLVEPDEEIDEAQLARFFKYMDNPDLQDVAAIVQQLVTNEKPRAAELGKVLMSMLPELQRLQGNQQPQPST